MCILKNYRRWTRSFAAVRIRTDGWKHGDSVWSYQLTHSGLRFLKWPWQPHLLCIATVVFLSWRSVADLFQHSLIGFAAKAHWKLHSGIACMYQYHHLFHCFHVQHYSFPTVITRWVNLKPWHWVEIYLHISVLVSISFTVSQHYSSTMVTWWT